MKILKRGKIPFKEKRFECHNCGSEFLADEKDRKLSPKNEQYVECPICGQYIDW